MDRTYNCDLAPNENLFMKIFKYYKCNKPAPSFEHVISLENDNISGKIELCNPKTVNEDLRTDLLGLKTVTEWKTYTFLKHPGLLLVRNPFTSLGQCYWIRKCLEQYSRKPNKTNIDIEMVIKDWWKECYTSGKCNVNLQKKLRWTTLGYHHNWDTKVYSEDNKSVFPEDLAELCDCVAQYLGYKNFRAEAAIVNFITWDLHFRLTRIIQRSTWRLHCFHLGGPDKSVEPSAVMLNSGDIVVMSKEARLSYHAVPKIVFSLSQAWNIRDGITEINDNMTNFKYITDKQQLISDMNRNIDNKEWNIFKKYVKESRINMNVRQVLNVNQESLHDGKFIKSV